MTKKTSINKTSKQSQAIDRTTIFDALASLNSTKEVTSFLNDLCTPQEVTAFQERWEIAQLLSIGELSYREISAKTGASTTTVSRVARFLNTEHNGGYRSVIEKQKN